MQLENKMARGKWSIVRAEREVQNLKKWWEEESNSIHSIYPKTHCLGAYHALTMLEMNMKTKDGDDEQCS